MAADSDVRSNAARAALNRGLRRVYSSAECTDAHWELHMSKHIIRQPKLTFRSRPRCGASPRACCSDAAGGLRLSVLQQLRQDGKVLLAIIWRESTMLKPDVQNFFFNSINKLSVLANVP